MNALLVKDEALRIEALNQYEVLNSAPDPVLDDLTQLAAQICDTPVAAVSFVGSDRIWIRSRFGMESLELSLGSLPCETTILATPSTRSPTRATIPTTLPTAFFSRAARIAFMPALL